jgi:putative acetyltransferase
MTEIRKERKEDLNAIRYVNKQAFETSSEANLVDLLRAANKATISLVAIVEGRIVGHILFSPVNIASAPEGVRGLGLGPMAVLPEFQEQGIGSSLIREGLKECQQAGYDIVVVLGHLDYYPRFGFSRASAYGLENEYDADEHFMALELRNGALAEVGGLVTYQPEFKEMGC